MQVPSVGGVNAPARELAPQYSNERIEHRQRPNRERGSHGDGRGPLERGADRQRSDDQADEHATGIAEENGGGREVKPQEAEQGAGKDRSDDGNGRLTEPDGHHGDGRAEDDADGGGKAIDAVEQVERVDGADEPEQREGN